MEDIKVEFFEKDGIGKIKINGTNIPNIKKYNIHREQDPTGLEYSFVEIALEIEVPAKNFKTVEDEDDERYLNKLIKQRKEQERNIEIDGTKVGEQIVPSAIKTLKEAGAYKQN